MTPAYTGRGHVGLTWGNKDEEAVWNEFAPDSPVGAGGFEPLHLRIEFAKTLQPGAGEVEHAHLE